MSSDPPPLIPPLPVEPLSYARPGTVRRGRPGILIAIGVASLLVGVVAAGLNLAQTIGFYEMCRGAGPPAPLARVPEIPDPNETPYDGDWTGPQGWKRPAREAARAALSRRGVSEDRLEMLDRLLAEAGASVFPGLADARSSAPPSAERVDGAIARFDREPTRKEEIYTKDHGRVIHDAKLPADRFDTAVGTVRLRNLRATFTPSGAESPSWAVDIRRTTSPDGAARLTAVEVADALDAMQRRCAGRMTARQATVAGRFILGHTTLQGEGTQTRVTASMPHAPTLTLDAPDGTETHVLVNGAVLAPRMEQQYNLATGQPLPPSTPPTLGSLPVSRAAANAFVLEPVLHGLAALWLCGMGVGILIWPARYVRNHVLYAVVKLLLAVYSIAASAWFLTSLQQGYDAALSLGYGNVPSQVWNSSQLLLLGGGGLLLQMTYPVVLLLVVRQSNEIRGYVLSQGYEPWPLSPERWRRWWRRAAEWATSRRGRVALCMVATVSVVLVVLNLVAFGVTMVTQRNYPDVIEAAGRLGAAAVLMAAAGLAVWLALASRGASKSAAGAVATVIAIALSILTSSARAADQLATAPAPTTAGTPSTSPTTARIKPKRKPAPPPPPEAKVDVAERLRTLLPAAQTAGERNEPRRRAIVQIVQLGPDAAAAPLLALIREGSPHVQRDVCELIPKLWFVDTRAGPPPPERIADATRTAAVVVDQLADDARRPEYAAHQFGFLWKVGIEPAMADKLLPLLQVKENRELRQSAARAISHVRGSDAEVLPYIQKLLAAGFDYTDVSLHEPALERLREIDPAIARPLYLEAARAPYREDVRSNALHALAEPTRKNRSSDDPPAPLPQDVEQLVLENAQEGPEGARRTACEILVRYGTKYLPVFVEVARSGNPRSLNWGMSQLEALCSRKKGGVDVLRGLLHDADPAVRVMGITAGRRAYAQGDVLSDEIVPLFDDESPDVRKAAARLVGNETTDGQGMPGLATCRRAEQIAGERLRIYFLADPVPADAPPVTWRDVEPASSLSSSVSAGHPFVTASHAAGVALTRLTAAITLIAALALIVIGTVFLLSGAGAQTTGPTQRARDAYASMAHPS